MTVEHLTKLVPPPKRPTEVGDIHSWRLVEQKLGLVLPADYRDFVLTYGTGLFARFYRIYNPFSVDKSMSLLSCVQETCDWRRETKRELPERVPYPIYPEKTGILPWGNDENGHDYYWLTRGSPDEWIVLADNVRGSGVAEHNCSMTEYLTGVLLGDIKPLAGDKFTRHDFVFKSFSR